MGGDQLRAQLARHRADVERVAALARRLTGTATSADQLIAVQIDARGKPTALRIEPAALRRYRSDQLAAEILRLVAVADEKIATTRNQLVATCVQSSRDNSLGADADD